MLYGRDGKKKKRQSLKKCARLIEKISDEVKVTFRHWKDYRVPRIFQLSNFT